MVSLTARLLHLLLAVDVAVIMLLLYAWGTGRFS